MGGAKEKDKRFKCKFPGWIDKEAMFKRDNIPSTYIGSYGGCATTGGYNCSGGA